MPITQAATKGMHVMNRNRIFTFTTRSGFVHKTELLLHPEIDWEPCVDDVHDDDGEHQFWYWVNKIKTECPEQYEQDAVPISWWVRNTERTVFESAPFQPADRYYINYYIKGGYGFLSYYTWPEDEDGNPLDWFTLPVDHRRFPKFADYLGWTPAPLQPTCPIRSIVESRTGQWTLPTGNRP